jgi:hypothetical protein
VHVEVEGGRFLPVTFLGRELGEPLLVDHGELADVPLGREHELLEEHARRLARKQARRRVDRHLLARREHQVGAVRLARRRAHEEAGGERAPHAAH